MSAPAPTTALRAWIEYLSIRNVPLDEAVKGVKIVITRSDTQGRLLPWSTEGKACYLSTDGTPGSVLSALADDMEAAQLAMGRDMLTNAREVLDDPTSPNAAVRYAAVRLMECLGDALRVAESRGMRLPDPDDDEAENEPETAAEARE